MTPQGFDASSSSDAFHGHVMNHENRLAKLEERTEHLASKEDLQKAMNAQTWRIITAIAGLVAAVVWITQNVLK